MTDVLDDARRVLATTVARWQSLAETAPDELLRRQPAPGRWSAADCLDHLLLTERAVFGRRLRAVLDGGDMIAFDPNATGVPEPQGSIGDRVAVLASDRAGNLAVLAGLGQADLDRAARHPDHGMVPLRVLLSTWTAHDLQHLVQAEEALMQAFLPGTGPFRYNFADHEVQPTS